MNLRNEQHKIIENTSYGTYFISLVADPINVATIFLPVLRSKSIYDAIRKGAIISGGVVAPLEDVILTFSISSPCNLPLLS